MLRDRPVELIVFVKSPEDTQNREEAALSRMDSKQNVCLKCRWGCSRVNAGGRRKLMTIRQ